MEALAREKEIKKNREIPIHGLIKNKRVIRFINCKYIGSSENLDKYVPKANGSGAIGEVLSTPMVGYTGFFIGIGAFDTQEEAENCMKYIKTKFARAMLGTLKVTQDNPRETWLNVPLQNFTTNSDIDWSKSVSEIDKSCTRNMDFQQMKLSLLRAK